jgi:undecaprenyl-phosphate 4-deoxy-4-formamido-L-arabinose transferase
MIVAFTNSCRNEDASGGIPELSIVVPVYRSASTLPNLVDEIQDFLRSAGKTGEIILVNDGSPDDSGAVAAALARKHCNVVAVDLLKNGDQHLALLTGLKLTRAERIITMDDDLQHPPSQILPLLTKLEEGYDVVYGVPETKVHGLWRDFCSVGGKMLLRYILRIKHAEDTSAFRVMRRDVIRPFLDYDNFYVDIDALLSWVTNRFTSVRVQHRPRREGHSNYTFRALLQHTLKMILGFTTLPLRVASIVGFIFTVLGMLLLVYVLVNYFIYKSYVPGFAFLASTITLLSGAQLFALGILGEYFSIVHFRIMGRPGAFVRRITRHSTDS